MGEGDPRVRPSPAPEQPTERPLPDYQRPQVAADEGGQWRYGGYGKHLKPQSRPREQSPERDQYPCPGDNASDSPYPSIEKADDQPADEVEQDGHGVAMGQRLARPEVGKQEHQPE